MNNQDLISYINEESKKKALINRLCGIRKKGNDIQGLIDARNEERFWLSKYQLCTFHEELIDKCLALGWEIE